MSLLLNKVNKDIGVSLDVFYIDAAHSQRDCRTKLFAHTPYVNDVLFLQVYILQ